MTPNTVVTLYQTDFDITNKHVVYVQSEGDALGAVSAYPSKVFPECSWQREGSAFRARGNINEIEKYNYCTFNNNGEVNFAFIVDCEYRNDDYTDVIIKIDPWLNYAGKYQFHDSPVIRQHPAADTAFLSTESEPVSADRFFEGSNVTYGSVIDDNMINVITLWRPDQYSTFETFWSGLAGIFEGNGNILQTIFENAESIPCDCFNETQGTTSILTPEGAQNCINNFLYIDRPDGVVAAYHIPKSFRSLESGISLSEMPPKGEFINLPAPASWSTAKWEKIKYSNQYNIINANIYGNSANYEIEGFYSGYLAPKQFQMIAFQGLNGQISLSPVEYRTSVFQNTSNYTLQSPSWDRVALTGGINANASTMGGYMAGGLTAVVGALLSGVSGGLSTGLMVAGGSQIAKTAISSIDIDKQTATYISGSRPNINSLSSYTIPIVITHYIPDPFSLQKLNRYFSTYGYSFGGKMMPLNLNNMPYWNYVETENAVITGQEVPQWAISQVIKMFNSGVFIYNNIGTYKKTENVEANIL